MLEPALVTTSTVPFFPELACCVDFLLGFVALWGHGPLLMKEWAVVTPFACSLEEIIANSFWARRSRLPGRLIPAG